MIPVWAKTRLLSVVVLIACLVIASPAFPVYFDNDAKSDIAVWRPSDGNWYVKLSGGGSSVTQWGDNTLGDIPVPGDYDGDGRTDVAVWRPSNGTWYVRPASGAAPIVTQWGDQAAGDIPVPGDFDGDGKTDFAVWRPSNGTWYVKPASGAAPIVVQWGDQPAGDIPVPGDYDGDWKTDFAVWRPSNGTWYVKPASGAAPIVAQWGDQPAGDIPVPGDYDGDGKTDFAVWRPSNGTWYVKPSSGAAPMVAQWGDQAAGDKPVPADHDGDGKTDFAVWRPSNGTWYVKPSSGAAPIVTQWGDWAAGDIPLNLAKKAGTYSLADLTGTWEVNSLASGLGANWWERGPITINSSGDFSGILMQNNGDPDTVSGTFSITADGVITVPGVSDNAFRCAMDSGRTVVACTLTWTTGSPGTTEIKVLTKKAGTYSLADLTGTWEVNSLASGLGANWWERGPITINSSGDFSGILMQNNGDPDTVSGTFSITADGVITVPGVSDNAFRCAMDSGRTVVACNSTWTTGIPGASEIKVLTKKSGDYSLADLAGTWEVNILASGLGAPWWERGLMMIDYSGDFSRSVIHSNGDPNTVSGTFSITSDGVITVPGVPDNAFRCTMDSGKTVVACNSTWTTGVPGTAEIKMWTKKASPYIDPFTGTYNFIPQHDYNIQDGVSLSQSSPVTLEVSRVDATNYNIYLTDGSNSLSVPLMQSYNSARLKTIPYDTGTSYLLECLLVSDGNNMAFTFIGQEYYNPLDISLNVGNISKNGTTGTIDNLVGTWSVFYYSDPNLRNTTDGFSARNDVITITKINSSSILTQIWGESFQLDFSNGKASISGGLVTGVSANYHAFTMMTDGKGLSFYMVATEFDDASDVSVAVGLGKKM